MVVVSYSGREINAKIVYYGPGLSGKTTNLEKIYDSVPETNRGRMVSMKTQTDRTLFFDLLPLDLGELQGMKTRFLLYTVPGQVYYNATRKLVLKGVDALVFVADSSPDKMAENRESLANLEQNLKAYGLNLKTVPWVIQFNKRDLPNAVPVEQMNKELNRHAVPMFEAQAASGIGVFETLRGVSKLLLGRISKDVIERGTPTTPRVQAGEPKSRPAGVGEAPGSSAAGRGKLMQFLKRGKGQEPAPGRAAHSHPTEHAPLLSDDALVEEAPTGGEFQPPPSMQPDEGILTSEDLIPIRRPGPAVARPEPAIVRQEEPEPIFSSDEIEREATYGGHSSLPVGSPSAETRQIMVPIDLGALPASGRLRLVFEVRLEVESPGAAKKGKRPSSRGGSSNMRDLETIPD